MKKSSPDELRIIVPLGDDTIGIVTGEGSGGGTIEEQMRHLGQTTVGRSLSSLYANRSRDDGTVYAVKPTGAYDQGVLAFLERTKRVLGWVADMAPEDDEICAIIDDWEEPAIMVVDLNQGRH